MAVCKQVRKDSGLQFRHNPEESRQEAGKAQEQEQELAKIIFRAVLGISGPTLDPINRSVRES